MLLASALGVLGLGAMAGPASAGIWSEIPSGTTEDITAIEYQGADRFWFTTGGKIYRRVSGTFQNVKIDPTASFRDIEFLPAPSPIGLAVGANGKIYRSNDAGATWDEVLPVPTGGHRTNDIDCATTQQLGDIDTVRFDGQGNPWLLAGGSQIFKATTPGGMFTYANGGATCKIDQDIDDAFFVPGTAAGYFVAKSFGAVWYSDNLATGSAFKKAADAGNGYQFRRRMTGDPANPQRQWAVFPDDGNGSYFHRTTDGWSSSTGWDVVNESVRSRSATADVDFAGGTVLAAGAAGEVLQSVDGTSFFFNGADSPLSSTDWLAVSLADGANGAVAGRGGKLVVTSQANVTPDEAVAASLPVSFTGPGNTLAAKIVGSRIRVTMKGAITPPAGAGASACSAKVTLRIKKGKRTMANRKVKLRFKNRKCRFSKTVLLKRSKVGKTNKLRLTVSHPGNSVLKKASKSFTLVIRK
jgi:hypothetical protein